MSSLQVILMIAGIHILGAMSPGPDFAVVVKNSIRYTRQLSMMTVLGIATGITVHLSYTSLGFGLTLKHAQNILQVVQYIGGVYMGYLGIKSLIAKSEIASEENSTLDKNIRKRSAFMQGLLCNLLNPKAAMFIIGSFSLVIRPQMPSWLLLVMCLEIICITFLWFGFLAFILTHPPVIQALKKSHGLINKAMGLLLVIFSIKLLFF